MQKSNKKKRRNIALSVLIALIFFMWANNTSLFTRPSGEMKLLAHRGLAQIFDISEVEWDTNTAAIIYEPEYPYLENTIESMQVAFDYGADAVELDIQLTKDKKLACFHDYTLDYRTDGTGEISDYTMEELKLLDIGYGYTADGGETYPFRGQGVGLMPSIEEVFDAFPNKELLIHIKSYTVETGEILWSYLNEMNEDRLSQITIYGSKDPVNYLRQQCPTLRVMTRDIMIKAVLTYEAIGWTGYIPEAIQNTDLHLPLRYARFLWGWPNKFVERMDSANTRIIVVDGNGKWSEGFDSIEDLKKLPEGYSGYVWTERIDRISDMADTAAYINQVDNGNTTAAKLVEDFGKKLQTVSLLAPEDIVKENIQNSYADYVSPVLLAEWENDLQHAPGRVSSSPWPDRIEILNIEKLSDSEYQVQGDIIEMTSVEMVNGGFAAKRPITLSVELIEDHWLITAVDIGEYIHNE